MGNTACTASGIAGRWAASLSEVHRVVACTVQLMTVISEHGTT